jgi:predicted PurR-regulated permease PerM
MPAPHPNSPPAPPLLGSRRWDFDRVIRLIFTVILLFALFALVRYLSDVLIPFAVALLLAYLLNPLVNALESRMHRRGLAVFVTVSGTAIVLFSLGLVLFVIGAREISSLRDLLREFLPKAPTAQDIRNVGSAFDAFIAEQQNPTIRSALEGLREELSRPEVIEALDPAALARTVARFLAPSLLNVLSGTVTVLLAITGVVVVMLYLVFLLLDYRELSQKWPTFLPPQYREGIVGFVQDFEAAMSRYFRGQFLIALCLGVVFTAGYLLIGLRAAVLLGVATGLLSMVPYLQAVALVPALLLGVVRSLEAGQALWIGPLLVLVVFVVAQLVQDWVLTPIIMGRSMGLRPVLLILSVFVWSKLLGFLGLVLAIPLSCLALAYYRRVVLHDATARPVEP